MIVGPICDPLSDAVIDVLVDASSGSIADLFVGNVDRMNANLARL